MAAGSAARGRRRRVGWRLGWRAAAPGRGVGASAPLSGGGQGGGVGTGVRLLLPGVVGTGPGLPAAPLGRCVRAAPSADAGVLNTGCNSLRSSPQTSGLPGREREQRLWEKLFTSPESGCSVACPWYLTAYRDEGGDPCPKLTRQIQAACGAVQW